MISVDENMIITRQVNDVMINYSKNVIFKDLLYKFSFPEKEIDGADSPISEILEIVNESYEPEFSLNAETHLVLSEFVVNYIDSLSEESVMALHYFILNEEYLHNLEQFDDHGDTSKYSGAEWNSYFGRHLAYKIYEPEPSGLSDDLIKYLMGMLCNFSSELDLSLVDEYTRPNIEETIEKYTEIIRL